MDNWLAVLIIVLAVVLIIGNFSTFNKTRHHKLRKTNLNDMKETLPRSKKTAHKMQTINKGKLK